MSFDGNAEYALTRVQSQYGSRPSASEWRRLEASHDLGQYLERTRSGVFSSWTASLDRRRGVHAIERTLRCSWRSYVRMVAGWHPRQWQAWLTWLEWLPTLGLIARLKSADSMPDWLLADPLLGPVAAKTSAERPATLKRSELAVFGPAIAGRVPLRELWLTHWWNLRPRMDALTEERLKAFSTVVEEHARGLTQEGANGVALRDHLQERLNRQFRAAAGTVVATLCHLALMALDFERLRGGLVNRTLFARGG